MAGEPVAINTLENGEQIKLWATKISHTADLITLDLHTAGYNGARRGQLRITRSGSEPYAIEGEFDDLPAGTTPYGFIVESAVFKISVGDQVVTTDGVHYVVQAIGSDEPEAQLPDGYWSPSTALNPQFLFSDVAQNLGPA